MRMIIVAGLLATTAMVSIGLDQKIHSRLDRLGEAKGFFLDAVGKTKEDLGLKLGLAAHDTTIGQHLAWRLSHSVRSALESHITPGQLDQLTLWTAAGVESGRTRDTELFRPFEPGRAAQAMERYLWRNQNEVPELVLLRPLLGSTTSVYVAGSVILNDTWLRRFPKLKKAIESERLSISLQAHEEKTLATLNDNNMKEPVLLMSQRSDILTWRHSATIVTLLSLATWTALVLAILSAALAVRKPYLDLRRTHEETKSFMRWCASLNTTKDHSQDAKYTLADARRMIERLLAEKAHEKNLLEVKSRELTTKIEEQGTELERRQSLLIGISHYHSLAIQIIPMLEVFLSETANIRSMALTLETSLRERLLKGAHSLQATMHTWIQDIEIRGSRKFIRSLAETPGKLPDKTALDDDLATLAANGDFLYLVAQETILSLENLHGNTAHLVKIVEHWEAIKDKHSIKQQAESPLSPLLEAQEMVALTSKNDGESVTFLNTSAEAVSLLLPPSPHSIWVSAFFHLLQAAHLSTGDKHSKISCRIRADRDRGLVVIQPIQSSSFSHKERALRSQETSGIDLARNLLASFGVTIQVLHSREGTPPLALHWTPAPSQKKEGDLQAAGHQTLHLPQGINETGRHTNMT